MAALLMAVPSASVPLSPKLTPVADRQRLERRAADPGRHAGELPAAGHGVQERVPFHVRQQPAVTDVQHVPAIVPKDAVRGIANVPGRLRRGALPAAADAQRLGPRVRRGETESRSLAAEQRLQRVVILVVPVLRHRKGAVPRERPVEIRIAIRIVQHGAERDVIQVVDAVVQQPVARAADVGGLDHHAPWEALLERQAVALRQRLLVVAGENGAGQPGLRAGVDSPDLRQRHVGGVGERHAIREIDELGVPGPAGRGS